MSILPFNLNTSTATRAEGEKVEYITPGAYECEITTMGTSDQNKDYKGSPYIDFNVKSLGKVGRCRFWAVKQTDKPSTQEWKSKQIKDFLVNAGVRDFSDDSKAMNDAIGKSLMVTFITEEYVGINRDNQEPVIRKSTKYRWSAKSGANCTYNDDMNQELSSEQMTEFSKKHSDWSTANKSMADSNNDEDMPF